MIEHISNWAEQIIVAVIIATIIEMILPNGNNKKCHENFALVAIITMISAPIEKIKSIIPLVILAKVKIYFGTYIFFNKAELPFIELNA